MNMMLEQRGFSPGNKPKKGERASDILKQHDPKMTGEALAERIASEAKVEAAIAETTRANKAENFGLDQAIAEQKRAEAARAESVVSDALNREPSAGLEAEIRAQKIEEGARISIERSGGKREATVLEVSDDGVTEMAYAIDNEGVPQLVAESIETSALKQELAEQAEAKLTESAEGRGERLLSDTLANVEAVNKALADKVAKAGKLFSGRATKFLTKALGAGTQVAERARLFANDIAGGSDAAEEQAPRLEEMRIPFQLQKETISATIKRAGEEVTWLKNVLTRQEKGIDWATAEVPNDATDAVVSELAEGLDGAAEEFFGVEKVIPAAEGKMVKEMAEAATGLDKVVRDTRLNKLTVKLAKMVGANAKAVSMGAESKTDEIKALMKEIETQQKDVKDFRDQRKAIEDASLLIDSQNELDQISVETRVPLAS